MITRWKPYLKLLLIVLISCISSCGNRVGPLNSDPAFLKYIESFEKDIGVKIRGLTIRFAKLEETDKEITLGECYGDTVQINVNVWGDLSELEREALMYHEFGHCVLYYDHNDDDVVDPDGNTINASLMNEYAIGGHWYYSNIGINLSRH